MVPIEESSKTVKANRIDWIDSMRGFLGLTVMLGHAIGWSGLTTAPGLFEILHFIIYSFHMPAFFLLSGYVYGWVKELRLRGLPLSVVLRTDVLKRTVTMAVPFAVCTLALGICLSLKQQGGMLKAASINWFVLIMIAFAIGHSILYSVLKKDISVILCIVVPTVIFGAFYNNTVGKFFGYYLCYEVGLSLGLHLDVETERKIFKPAVGWLEIAASAAIMVLCYLKYGQNAIYYVYYKTVVGILTALSLMSFFRTAGGRSRLFKAAGKLTLQMYLLQWFWALAVRLQKYSPFESFLRDMAVVVGFTSVSFLLPVVLDRVCGKTLFYNLIFRPYAAISRLQKAHKRSGN